VSVVRQPKKVHCEMIGMGAKSITIVGAVTADFFFDCRAAEVPSDVYGITISDSVSTVNSIEGLPTGSLFHFTPLLALRFVLIMFLNEVNVCQTYACCLLSVKCGC
jgi:hypothetical protein